MPPSAVAAIAAALEAGTLRPPYLAMTMRDLPSVADEKAAIAQGVLARAATVLDPEALALFLRTVDELRRAERLDRPEIEIAWTGPNADGPLVRPTRLVIEEMLRGVRHAGEILLVGYAFTVPEGSAMEGVVGLLEEAARKKARITLVLHRGEDSEGLPVIERMWDAFLKKPRVLTWSPQNKHSYTKLHAKVLVVDRVEMLVGSANFTFLGLESNLELGVRIRGPHAGAVAERFDHLIGAGELISWDGAAAPI
jgi:phosphatidylserine/phosphatidylglycerophosphate/cardiolipin synthase-like enzyme